MFQVYGETNEGFVHMGMHPCMADAERRVEDLLSQGLEAKAFHIGVIKDGRIWLLFSWRLVPGDKIIPPRFRMEKSSDFARFVDAIKRILGDEDMAGECETPQDVLDLVACMMKRKERLAE